MAELTKCTASIVREFDISFSSPSDAELHLHNRVVMDIKELKCKLVLRNAAI